MISRRIDLTEHSDFSGGHVITPMDQPIPDFMFYEKMEPKEMEKFLFKEKFFGKFTHYTEKYKVFNNREEEFKENVRTHCERCGREIRAPWTKIYGLCPECNDIMENDGVPWKNGNRLTTPDEAGAWDRPRNVAYDLFNAR